MKKISVIVNKNWETEPMLNALINYDLRPSKLPFPDVINSPKDRDNKMHQPRAIFSFLDDKEIMTLQVSVWCIQDLMYIDIPPDRDTQSSSSSKEKFRVLPPVILNDNPDLVIAVGTAGFPSETSMNGSIIIGSNFFVHNGNPKNRKSELNDHPDIGKILLSNVNASLFDLINKDFKNQVEPKFIKPPRNPAIYPVCIASKVYTSISSINVTDYSEYNWVDHEAIENFNQAKKQTGIKIPFNSIETTHGVIKFSTNKPILFVSAIADRLGYFDSEVTATQNYTVSFNAGIVLGQLLCSINDFVLQGKSLEKQN